MGRRIAKKIDGITVEKYLWLGLTQLLAVYDGSDNLIMRFESADDRVPFAITKGGSTYYLTYDQVGSLRLVADTAGNVVKKITYDSFGNIINDTNPGFVVPFGFAGGLHDRDTGLVRFGFRDYDPDIGRWTAKDPIFFSGGDTDLYGYCLNDPVNLIDTFGLWDMISSYRALHGSRSNPLPRPPMTPERKAVIKSAIESGIKKITPVVVGVIAGVSTENPIIGTWVYWTTDSMLDFLSNEPIADKWFGIEIINPPEVHAPEKKEDLCP